MHTQKTLSYFLLGVLTLSVIFSTLATAQNAEALSAANFSSQPTFTSINSGKWSRVWDNGSGSTYFLDVSGGNFKSVKINSSTGAIQSSATTLVSGTPTTVTTETASSTRTDTFYTQGVGGTTQSLFTGSNTFITEYVATSASLLVGQNVNSMTLYLKKTGAPTGTAIVGCFDSSGNTIIQFGTQDVSLLTTSFVATTFTTTSATRTIANGDRCGVFFNSGSAGNTLDVEYDAADIYDGTTNTIVSIATGAQGAAAYSSQTTRELRGSLAYVYSAARVNTASPSATQLYENQGTVIRGTQTNFDGSVTLYANTVQRATEKVAGGTLSGVSVDTLDVYMSKTGSPSGTITAGVWSGGSSTNKVSQATNTDGGLLALSTSAIQAAAEHITASGALVGQTVNSMTLSLKKANTPTGTLTACVMDFTGACVYTFGSIDISTLTTSYAAYTFTNTGSSRTIAAGDYIGVKGPVQTGSNTVTVSATNVAGTYDGTNSQASQWSGSVWTDASSWDLGSTSGAWKLDLVTAPTLAYTFNTMSASALTTSVAKYSFTNTGSSITLSPTQYIGVEYSGGDGSNNIQVYKASADSFDGTTNAVYSTWLTGWTDTTTSDLTFRAILSANNNVENGAWIKADFGSNQSVQAMYAYFSDVNKIPQVVNMLTSTDDITYTSQANVTLTQATGGQFVSWSSAVTARYVKMQVTTWGSAKSMQLESYIRVSTSGNGVISGVETVGGVNRVYYAELLSTTSMSLAIINIDNGATISTATQTITAVQGTTDYMGMAVSPNGIWIAVKGNGGGGYQVFYGSRALGALTQAANLSTGNGGSSNFPCEMAVDGASQAQDVMYCAVATGTQSHLYKATTAAVTSIANIGAAGTGVNPDLVDVSGKMIVRMTVSGATNTYTIDKSTDTLSASLYSQSWNTWAKQQYDFNGVARTYKSNSIAYFATTSKSVSWTATTGALTDPAQIYVETVTPGTGTLSGVASTFYRVNDGLVVTGSGTTWTPKTISGVVISPTLYSERLGVPLTANSTVFGNNVVKLVCDAPYTFFMPTAYVGSDSDCSVWRVYDTSSGTIGRELPYTKTQNLVHTPDYTNYNIHATLTKGLATDYYAIIVYDSKNVDRSQFDNGNNAQLRMLYGQCYTLEYVKVLDGSVAQSTRVCADDVIFKESVLSTELGFTFWSSVWAGYHTYDNTNHTLTTITRHTSQPYNYTVNIYNATGGQLETHPYSNIGTEVDTRSFNLTSYVSQKPLQVKILNDVGNPIYSAWVENNGNWLSGIRTGLGADISFDGFSLLMFLPIIFAAIFTRTTAGIGGGMLVAMIGMMVFFGVISQDVLTPQIMGLITFVAIVGILAYRFLYQ